MIVRTLGIDPGSRNTGYGIVEVEGNRLRHLESGVIRLAATAPFHERLGRIYQELTGIIARTQPNGVAIEEVFFAKNVKSALRLGEARGAALLAAINSGLHVHEYPALQIKQAIVGYGRAGKDQVIQMIRYLFKIQDLADSHAADALAVAVCHLNTFSSTTRWRFSSNPGHDRGAKLHSTSEPHES